MNLFMFHVLLYCEAAVAQFVERVGVWQYEEEPRITFHQWLHRFFFSVLRFSLLLFYIWMEALILMQSTISSLNFLCSDNVS